MGVEVGLTVNLDYEPKRPAPYELKEKNWKGIRAINS